MRNMMAYSVWQICVSLIHICTDVTRVVVLIVSGIMSQVASFGFAIHVTVN